MNPEPVAPELLLSHAGLLRRLARGLTSDPASADDLVQDTFAIAIERPPRAHDALRTWLARVIRNLASRLRRAEAGRARRERSADIREPVTSPDRIAEQQELLLQVARAVRALPEPYRSTIHHRYYDGLTPSQIAERLGLSEATVKTRLRRGLAMMRSTLDRDHGGERRAWALPLSLFAGTPQQAALPVLLGVATMSTRTLVSAGCALVLGCLAFLAWPDEPGGMPESARTAAAPAPRPGDAPQTPALERRATTLPAAAADESRVAGVVRDEAGRPVAGVGLRVLTDLDPYGPGIGRWRRSETLRSDEKGRFDLPVPRDMEAQVSCHDLRFEVVDPAPRVRAPADVELVVRSRPYATVVVRVRDLSTGELVPRFGCDFHIPVPGAGWPTEGKPFSGGALSGRRTEDGVLEQVVPLRSATEAQAVQISLRLRPGLRHRLFLAAGEEREVELGWKSGPVLAGIVLDAKGNPVAGALVYGGTQERARGDTPFEPFRRAHNIHDAVRTDARGRFRLPIGDSLVTAWHEDHTPVTVPVTQAHRIVLPALGGIRGRLIDRAGRGRAGVEICLDRSRLATTDGNGAFRFDGVEAGIRGLHIPGPNGPRHLGSANGGPWSVKVYPGHASEVVLDPGYEQVLLQVLSGGRPYREWMGSWACLVGLGDLASFPMVEGRIRNGRLTFRGVVPGDYVLVTQERHVVPCHVDSPEGTVELGGAALVVQAEPGARLSLVPEGANELVRLMAARARVCVPESGTLTTAPLPEGIYELLQRGSPEATTVRVTGPQTRVVLD